MQKKWIFLLVLVLISLTLAGCNSIGNKPTGRIALTFTIPDGPSEYPPYPPHKSVSRSSDDIGQREIPAGTTAMWITIYNEATNYSFTEYVDVIPGQYSYSVSISGIPVGSGYTIEVMPIDDQYWTLTVGRASNIDMVLGETTAISMTLERIEYSDIICPSMVDDQDDPFSVSASLKAPFTLPASNIDEISAYFSNDDPSISWYTTFTASSPLTFIGDSWTNVEIDNVDLWPGNWHLDCIVIAYIQPVTNAWNYLCCLFDPAPETVVYDGASAIIGIN